MIGVNKKVLNTIFIFLLAFILSGCVQQQSDINPVKVKQSKMISPQKVTDDFMILQTDNQGFPQSQGVFDFKNGVLHIVKQYIPEIHAKEEDTKLEEYQNYRNKIEKDFALYFSDQDFDSEPYSVYQRTLKDCQVTDDGNHIVIKGEGHTIRFDYVKEDTVIDENYVEYHIYR